MLFSDDVESKEDSSQDGVNSSDFEAQEQPVDRDQMVIDASGAYDELSGSVYNLDVFEQMTFLSFVLS